MNDNRGLLVNARLASLAGEAGYGVVEDGALAWRDGQLTYAGSGDALPEDLEAGVDSQDAGGCLVTPGLIDCHTHLVFGGQRAGEFEQRLEGASYEEIARAGGGITATVRATREASEEALLEQGLSRAGSLLRDGVTTLEIKSGYGLDLETERRMLRVARRIGETLGITVRTSFLGLHALPPEFADDRERYVSQVCEEMLPALHAEGLVDAVDGFCEGIGFTRAETQRLFEAAKALDVPVKLHAEQLSDLGGAELVAQYNGLSADHLEYAGADAVRAMAQSGSVAVLLPGAFYALRETRLPPIDLLREHAVAMAVASDLNPGTSPLLSLRLAMSMACTLFRLTPEESIRGATVNAAQALGLHDRGTLQPGQRADFVLWNARDPAELCYWIGGRLAERIFVGGAPVITN